MTQGVVWWVERLFPKRTELFSFLQEQAPTERRRKVLDDAFNDVRPLYDSRLKASGFDADRVLPLLEAKKALLGGAEF